MRALAARVVGADERVGGAGSISIVPNTTWGLDIVAQGLAFERGDSVVTTASEFPANLAPWIALETKGVSVRRVPTRDGAFTAEEVAAACDGTTRLVSVSLVAYHTGFRAPVEELGAFCRSRGIVFGLDAIQAVGAQRVDVPEWNVDFLSADAHKWMLGPEGCGILFTTPDLNARLVPPAGWTNLKRAHGADFRVPGKPEYRHRRAPVRAGRASDAGAVRARGIARASPRDRLSRGRAPDREDARGSRRRTPAPRLHADSLRRTSALGHPRGAPAGREGRVLLPEARRRREHRDLGARRLRALLPHVGNDEEEAERVLALLKRL